ncbi:leucine-rich repeat-containing protein 71 isoform X2 [Athene noctua]|uniref:leucine-rich repeat-containing protein 71 isoform X2 n=1 Tax=Athene noctua TaxID=126797 RepID=UPI003EBE6A54
MRRRGERVPREKVAEEEVKSGGRKAEQGAEQYQCSGLLEQDFPELCARAGITGVPRVTLRPPPSFPAEAPHPGREGARGSPQRPRRLPARLEARGGRAGGPEPVPARPGRPAGSAPLEGRADGAAAPGAGGTTGTLPPPADAQPGGEPFARTRLPHAAGERQHAGPPLPAQQQHRGRGRPAHRAEPRLQPQPRLAQPQLQPHLGPGGWWNRPGGQGRAPGGDTGGCSAPSTHPLPPVLLQGLRLNRSLLSLSLANNDIGDAGATRLAEVLGPFALTHAEVVERRRLLLAEALGRARTTSKETEGQSEHFSSLRSSAAAPDTLPPAKHGKKKKELLQKEEARQAKKSLEPRRAPSKTAKPSGQEKLSPEVGDAGGTGWRGGAQFGGPTPLQGPPRVQLLLEEAKQHLGSIILPGNRALLNLNLSYNHVTERGLGALLAALERQQREAARPGTRGLLCLSLEGNRIPPTSPAFARLQELLLPLDSLRDEEEEEDGGA